MKVEIEIDFSQVEREEAHLLAEEIESQLGKPSFKLIKSNEIILKWD
jgi:hypothetical protein